MLRWKQQAAFVEEALEIFLPIPGGGEPGCTDGCTPNGVETANGYERKDKPEKTKGRSTAE